MWGAAALACGAAAVAAAAGTPQPAAAPGGVVAYEGARLITGLPAAPIEDAVLLVADGVVTAVGARGELTPPAAARRVDLSGRTVMPALVSLHAHVGFQDGPSYAAGNYTRANIIDHLRRYAYYGVGTIVSLGTDAGDAAFDIRGEQATALASTARLRTAGRGLAAPNAGPGALALRSSAYGVTSAAEGRRYVAELAERAVDVVKIWVDDRGGTVRKLEPVLYREIIDEAHARGLRVVAHVFYHDDAWELVRAGVDGFAHLVRDREMEAALIAAIVERDVFVMPNLGVSERRLHAGAPGWLDDPFLAESVPAAVRRRAADALRAQAGDAPRARQRYAAMERSLEQLAAAGARVVLGADSGVRDHFFGYAEHRELELMVAAGLTPAQAIVAATSRAAAVLGLADAGSLAAGRSADFIVLDADPLDDIKNTRRISAVYLRGARVDRAALRTAWAE